MITKMTEEQKKKRDEPHADVIKKMTEGYKKDKAIEDGTYVEPFKPAYMCVDLSEYKLPRNTGNIFVDQAPDNEPRIYPYIHLAA